MEKMFSVIIPCYNAQDFVDTAIKSVMDQTIDKSLYEVIAVNDASTDDTLKHLNGWREKYPDTIKVISYEENLRQGGARNRAIKEASGKYVCFLDADDWLECDALAVYMMAAKESDYDMITSDNTEDTENGYRPCSKNNTEISVKKRFSAEDNEAFMAENLGYVCTSVYRLAMITENEVWFPEHLAYEDIYWQRMIKFYVKNALVVENITYHHYIHDESTINKRNAPHQTDRLTTYEMLLEEAEKKGFLEKYHDQMMADTMETYLFNSYFLFFMNMDETPDVYKRIRTTIYRYFPDWEEKYDDSTLPMVFAYLLKFLKKAENARPSDLQPFKDAITELAEE